MARNTYSPHTWTTGEIITKEKMNQIESGIAAIDTEIAAARGEGGSGSGTLGQRIDDIVIVSNTEPTSEDNEIWINTSLNNGPIEIPTQEEFEDLRNSIAEQYSDSATYAVGKYVLHENNLYCCTTAVTTAGSWANNSSNFTIAVLANQIQDLRNDALFRLNLTHVTDINATSANHVDLNDYIIPGNYKITTMTIAGYVDNIPVTNAGRLTVLRTSDDNQLMQFYIANVSAEERIYFRSKLSENNGWTDWSHMLTNQQLATAITENDMHAVTSGAVYTVTSALQSDIDNVPSTFAKQIQQNTTWVQGGINSANGTTTSNNARIRTQIMRGSCDGLLVHLPEGMKAAAYAYVNSITTTGFVSLIKGLSAPDSSGYWYTPVTAGLAYVVVVAYANNEDITPANAANISIYKCYQPNFLKETAGLDGLISDSGEINGNSFVWELGSINLSTGANADFAYTIRTQDYIPVEPGRVFSYNGNSDSSIAVYIWIYNATKGFVCRYNLLEGAVKVPQNGVFARFTYGHTSDSNIKVTDGKDLMDAFVLDIQNKTFRDYLSSIGFLSFGIKKGYWKDNGTINSNTTGICSGSILHLHAGAIVKVIISEPGWIYSIKQGDAANSLSFTDRLVTYSEFAVSKEYVGIILYKADENGEMINLQPEDYTGQVLFFVSGYETMREVEIHDIPENIGVLNVINRAYQMAKLTYKTVANLPTQVNTTAYPHYIPSGKTVKGVMYSSTRDEGLYVPQCVSIDTYMTALLNPNSYIYTKTEPSPHYNALTYYGAVCSSFVGWCYGVDSVVPTTISFNTLDGMEAIENQSPYGLKLGDSLNKANTRSQSGHIVIITDIMRNNRGIIKQIEICEQTNISDHPMTRLINYTPEQVQSTYFDYGYVAYRYHYIYKVPYTMSPWINLDDETIEPTPNLNLSPRRGDKANWRPNEIVAIDILDAGSYTNVKLYKETTLISNSTISGLNVLTYTNLSYGSYSVCLTDGTTDSPAVYFNIIDTSETYTPIGSQQITVTYSSENGTPASICFCESNSSDSDYKAIVAFHILTDAEISAGSTTVTAPNVKTYLMKTMYKTAFGLYSSDLTSVTVT